MPKIGYFVTPKNNRPYPHINGGGLRIESRARAWVGLAPGDKALVDSRPGIHAFTFPSRSESAEGI